MTGAIDILALHLVGGRLRNEPSHAQRQEQYGDPAKHVTLKGDSMQGTKQIETILRYELDNWMWWGRRRDWMPVGFRCPLGMMYKSLDREDVEAPKNFIPCDEIGAAQFERIVVALPQRHREAFVAYHLEKAAAAGYVVFIKGRNDAARLLGVQVRQYHYMVNQAHGMVLRECIKIKPGIAGDDD